MSGHSKWATIKRQKGVNDMKRGQVFTRLSNAIAIAVREGGSVSDPESNFRLRLAIEDARAANMPKENIERAIKRATGRESNNIEEGLYEGFGPGGFSVIVETLTDNKQRTISEVKTAFDKNGGRLGEQGSVLYQFEKKGVIVVKKNEKSVDDVFGFAVDLGADDIEEAGDEVIIYTNPIDLAKIRNGVVEIGLSVAQASLSWQPKVFMPITDSEMIDKAIKFIDKLESLDDVHRVYTNLDIPEELIK